MRFDKVVTLVAVTYAKDAIGQEVATEVGRAVYANEFTVSRAEFYDAGRSGLKPEREYQIRSCEYEDESLLVVDGVEYQIIRADRRGEWTALVCQRNVGNAEPVS